MPPSSPPMGNQSERKYPRYSQSGKKSKPYRLDETYVFNTSIKGYTAFVEGALLVEDGTLFVYQGYCWDMASGAIDTPDMAVASLAHDPLCEMANNSKLPCRARVLADREFRKILKEFGCSWLRRWYSWCAVRANTFYKCALMTIDGARGGT